MRWPRLELRAAHRSPRKQLGKNLDEDRAPGWDEDRAQDRIFPNTGTNVSAAQFPHFLQQLFALLNRLRLFALASDRSRWFSLPPGFECRGCVRGVRRVAE